MRGQAFPARSRRAGTGREPAGTPFRVLQENRPKSNSGQHLTNLAVGQE
jgi:hypothetical protein